MLGAIDISGPAAHRASGDGAAGLGHGPARGEPAAGAPRHRRRAAAGPQHAAPREPARPAGRARHAERADHRRRAVRRLARARRADRAGRGARPARRRPRDGRRAARRGLPAARDAAPPAPPRAAGALSLRFLGEATRGAARRHGRSRSRCGRPSCSPRWRCTPTGSPPSGWRCCSTATTATRPRCAARSSGCAP